MNIKSIAIVPCKMDSTRLTGKNLSIINDKTLLEHTLHYVIGLQPDNPDRSRNLDEILEYFVNKKYDDLVTVDPDGTRNGSVRVIKAEFVKADNVSRRVGAISDVCTNIHTQEDLEQARQNMRGK